MKSIIRKILREQIDEFDQDVKKGATYDKILNDILENFNRDTIRGVWGDDQSIERGAYKIYSPDDFDLFTKTVEFANLEVGPYLEEIYGLTYPKETALKKTLLTDWIRHTYQGGNGALPGDTIEMLEMYDEKFPIKPGTRGVIESIKSLKFGGDWEEHVEVNWENNRTLKVILPFDKIKKIS